MDEKFLKAAIELGNIAGANGDVPIGAVIVKNNKIIAKGYNKKNKLNNALCHAEIVAINKACKKLGNFRLDGCDIYVNFEPCLMCVGAILSARISNVYFGAYDKRFGACTLLTNNNFNHKCNYVGGILEDVASKQISDFFVDLRNKK